MKNITVAYRKRPELQNLLLDDYFLQVTQAYQSSICDIISLGVQAGVPMPAMMAALAYFDGYRTAVLPANLIQAQQDYFGAHTYQRNDRSGKYHYPWYDEA